MYSHFPVPCFISKLPSRVQRSRESSLANVLFRIKDGPWNVPYLCSISSATQTSHQLSQFDIASRSLEGSYITKKVQASLQLPQVHPSRAPLHPSNSPQLQVQRAVIRPRHAKRIPPCPKTWSPPPPIQHISHEHPHPPTHNPYTTPSPQTTPLQHLKQLHPPPHPPHQPRPHHVGNHHNHRGAHLHHTYLHSTANHLLHHLFIPHPRRTHHLPLYHYHHRPFIPYPHPPHRPLHPKPPPPRPLPLPPHRNNLLPLLPPLPPLRQHPPLHKQLQRQRNQQRLCLSQDPGRDGWSGGTAGRVGRAGRASWRAGRARWGHRKAGRRDEDGAGGCACGCAAGGAGGGAGGDLWVWCCLFRS